MEAYFYAHLRATNDHSKILESVKLPLAQSDGSLTGVKNQILHYLKSERDDGNKLYEVTSVEIPSEDGTNKLESDGRVSPNDDVFVIVDVKIDTTRHVKPISTASVSSHVDDKLKFKTLTKYTYAESDRVYVKVDLLELSGLTKENRIEVDF